MNMKNSVSVVNSTSPPNCTLKDVQKMGVATTYWTIDDEGCADVYLEMTDSDFYEEQYYCDGCSNHFSSFEEVKEHCNAGI